MKVVVLTGAGMSAESGISTFRDNGGLWDQYNVEDVATPEGWARNPQLVTEFYNERRRQLMDVEPCLGHRLVARLEEMYDEVNGLIKDVRQIVDNYRDTTPISTFGSLIMGGL